MNANKQGYLAAIRANTAYPNYRGVIGVITTILIILAGLQGLGALVMGFGAMQQIGTGPGLFAILIGLGVAALSYFLAQFWKEAAQIVADIGDAILEANTPAAAPPPAAAYPPAAYQQQPGYGQAQAYPSAGGYPPANP